MALLALWNPNIQFLKTDGTINAGGKIIVTYHNDAESIPANYSDADGTTLNSSPIVLDALGRATCYIDDVSTYDLYVKDANGATLWTVPEMTPGTETIVVRGGFSVSSNDRSVAVTISVDSDGVTNYDLSIKNEIDRATEAEKGLADAIETEKTRAEETERTLSGSISKETERAIAAEKASRTEIVSGNNITVDKTTGADGHDIYTIKAEAGTASPLMDGKASVGNSIKYAREDHVHPSDTSREDKANKTTVVLGTSNSKYPTDKAVAEFVNSSIATNTANYISNNGEPFTSVEQLEAYSGPVTNNDYAFVTGTDSEGNTYYDRYKATVSGETVTWALEYRLNNSSFTAAQWSAINSGITSALVAKIHDHSNKDVLDGITSDKVNSWDGKEDAFDVLPTTKGGTGTNAASQSALTSSLINSLSTESSTPVDADYYVSQYQNGGTSNTSFVRRPISALWGYIKDKISSVLGLTDSAYSGKAATAGTADKAVADKSGNDIETTYATKTELNAKQNNLTAGDNITIDGNTISSNQLFVAKYGTTKYAEIKEAYNAGKICTVLYAARYFYVNRIDSSYILFVSSNGGNEMYALSVGSGNTWSFTSGKLQSKLKFDTTPTSGSTNPVTSEGIKTALEVLQSNIDTVDAKGIVINEIDGENVICFE